MRIDIFSDTICPWCFIGKRRLERALKEGRGEIEVHWRAFQLNPDMPKEGMERTTYLERKFGGPAGAADTYERIREVGKGERIDFAFERIARTPNTIESHRLIRFAADHGLEDAMVERLFAAYFLEGVDIGKPESLVRLARETGLDERATESFLTGDEHREEVLAEDLFARQQGIHGVPCFVFDGRYAVSGAQEPEVLAKVLDSLKAAASEEV
jgi:predicted DsbA family dithiol-disulfide isomerase